MFYLQVDLTVILCGKFSFGIPQGSFCINPQCTLFVNSKHKSPKFKLSKTNGGSQSLFLSYKHLKVKFGLF